MADESEFSTEIPKHVLEAVKSRSLTNVRDSIRIKKTKEKEKISDRERLASIGSKNSLTKQEASEVKSLMKRLSKSLTKKGHDLKGQQKSSPEKSVDKKGDRNSSDDASADHCDLKVVKRRLSHIGSKASITREEAKEVKTLMKKLSARLPLDSMKHNFTPDPELIREVQRNSSTNVDFRTDSIELQKQRSFTKARSKVDMDDFVPDPELLAKVQKRSKGGFKQKVIRDSILITKTRQRVASSDERRTSLSPLMDAFLPPPQNDDDLSARMEELELSRAGSV